MADKKATAKVSPAPAVVPPPASAVPQHLPDATKNPLPQTREIPRKARPRSNLSQELENGPNANRSCTDMICCLLFLLFVGFIVYVTATAFSKGDPWRLAQPYDTDSNPCGSSGTAVEDYPYAYFFNPTKGLDYVVCLKECPTWDQNLASPPSMSIGQCYLGTNGSTLTGISRTGATTCDGSTVEVLDISSFSIYADLVLADRKSIKMYRTQPILRRFCYPLSFNEASSVFYQRVVSSTGSEDKMDEYFSDLRNSWAIILISFAFAFVVSFLYLIVLRWCTGVFVWATILLFLALVLGCAILLHIRSKKYEESTANTDKNSSAFTTANSLYWMAVALYIVFAAMLCGVCCFFKTIELSVAVLKSAALFVRAHMKTVLVPVTISLVAFGYLMFALYVLLFLWSIGTPVKRANLPLAQIQWDTSIRRLIWAHLYSVLFVLAIFLYWGNFIVICSASLWYFNQGGESGEAPLHPSPVKTSVHWSVRYHFGSIVFASFLLSVIWLIKIILLYIKDQAEKLAGKKPEACLVRSVLCIMMCFVQCFERFIKFVSKTGLTMVSITGQSFCPSCRDGLTLLLRHPLKFGLVGVLGDVFVYLGEFFIAILTTFAGYIVVSVNSTYKEKLYSPLIPCVFFFIIGMLVGTIFMAVYGLAADAIMLCYLVDKDLLEKNQKKVHRVPAPLKEFFEENKTDSGFSDDEPEKPKK